MPNSKVFTAINGTAFICSTALVGISIAAIYLASDAYDIFTERFPPGSYGWAPSHWYGDGRKGWSIFINYNRSSEVKTYVAAAFALAVGLLGTFAFGLSLKRPAAPLLQVSLLGSAAFACIAGTVCAIWSAVAEVNIKRSSCWFEPAVPGGHYSCSIENSACNAIRFTDEISRHNEHQGDSENYDLINKACLQFRHARYLVVPLAAISLLLVGLYGAQVWLAKGKEKGDEDAEARVRALTQESMPSLL